MWYSSLEKYTKGPSVHYEHSSQLNILVAVVALELRAAAIDACCYQGDWLCG